MPLKSINHLSWKPTDWLWIHSIDHGTSNLYLRLNESKCYLEAKMFLIHVWMKDNAEKLAFCKVTQNLKKYRSCKSVLWLFMIQDKSQGKIVLCDEIKFPSWKFDKCHEKIYQFLVLF